MQEFDIDSTEKNIEDLYREIEETNNINNSKTNIIKDVFNQIKSEYKCKYERINFKKGQQEEFFKKKVNEILKKKRK